ncbi:MAG: hypothetical protein HY287_02450 [Planctomycetes bacterium]|nr:hypothetical protein [Planctomycetota bacterium]MBI3833170.1 hypothetical protein [Planctomycetota bacterium]
MRPNVKTTLETLNVDALPPLKGVEFDYRTQSSQMDRGRIVVLLPVASVYGMLLAILIQLTSGVTVTPTFLAAACLLSALAAFWRFYPAPFLLYVMALLFAMSCFSCSWNFFHVLLIFAVVIAVQYIVGLQGVLTARPLYVLIAGPCIALLCLLCNTTLFPLLLVAVMVYGLTLIFHMTCHRALWFHANPYLSRRVRCQWRAIWRPVQTAAQFIALAPWQRRPQRRDHGLLTRELAERDHYVLGFGVMVFAALFSILVYDLCLNPLLRGTLAVLTYTVFALTYGAINVIAYRSASDLWPAVRELFRAAGCWCTYNRHATLAPGVLQSPFGSAQKRTRRFLVSTFGIALVILPTCWFFPVGAWLRGMDSFLWSASAGEIAANESFMSDFAQQDKAYLDRIPHARQDAEALRLQRFRTQERLSRKAYADLFRNPTYTLYVHVRAAYSGDPLAIIGFLLCLTACLFVPPVILLATFWALSGRILFHHFLTLEGVHRRPGEYHPSRRASLWAAYTTRIRDSRFRAADEFGRSIEERRYLLVGFDEHSDYPVLLSPAVLAEHAHITGDSGSGKSSLGLAPIIEQLIDQGDCSVVILDLKGDPAMFGAAKAAVRRVNARNRRQGKPLLPFRWFTNKAGRSTYAFNPFLQADMQSVTPHQRAEILLQSLGLEYGEGFGPAFFSSGHRHVLQIVLEKHPQFASFRDLDDYFRSGAFASEARALGIDKKSREEASHLYAVVQSLAAFDALNLTQDPPGYPDVMKQQIEMRDVVGGPQVVHFALAAALEEKSVSEIAKLALRTLLVSAVSRRPANHQVYLFIDEFQQVVSKDLEIVLRQARSSGIAAILANQTQSDLKKGEVNLIPTVQANTRFRQVFSCSDLLHQNALIEGSGEAMHETSSWVEDEFGMVHSADDGLTYHREAEQIGPRLRRNDLIEATDHPLRSIVQITRGQGMTQFGGYSFPLRSMYHITPAEYGKRQSAPWPAQHEHPGTLVAPLDRAGVDAQRRQATTTSPPVKKLPAHVQLDLEERLDRFQRGEKND